MHAYRSILFDLDGTITRSSPGITRSLQYGLAGVGIEEPDPDRLMRFIGPPLNVELAAVYHLSPAAIETVLTRFRARYETTGMYECSLYPDMARILRQCAASGFCLAVASSKPDPHVKALLRYFGIDTCFTVTVGSSIEEELDNRTKADNKSLIIAQTLSRLGPAALPAIMVGDTKYDITGARQNGLDSIAVTYGYGPLSDLEEARPTYMADTPQALEDLLLSL